LRFGIERDAKFVVSRSGDVIVGRHGVKEKDSSSEGLNSPRDSHKKSLNTIKIYIDAQQKLAQQNEVSRYEGVVIHCLKDKTTCI